MAVQFFQKTKIFKRLPKDTGVTFEGFEDIRIRGREIVREQLEKFFEYCKVAKGTALRIILGEWGEGKTDAYKRYIHPKCEAENNLAFFVSASNLSNSFDLATIKKLFETTSLPSVRFLVALFYSIKQEQKEVPIPSPEEYNNAEVYLETTFENLIGGRKSRRIFVFIDEFEELLLYTEKLKQIISGIKEVINGQYRDIDEGGKYEGCLHLIIAATPDAFYRLQVSEETSLIFGGLGRRAGVIDLPQIRKEEGTRFLFALLNYSYENDLPEVLPFKTLGIFNAIFRITQGNPGNIVTLFTRLMNSAKIDEHYMKVIDYEHFLKFLEKQQVFLYGGSSACLESETFLRMLKIVENQRTEELGKKCGDILKLLTGELKPFSTSELSKRMNSDETHIKHFIAIVNDNLKERENINRAILKLAPLKKDKSFADVKQAFKEYISMEREKEWIKIDNYSESLEDFEDRITYFDIEGGKVVSKLYLPSDDYSVSSFFEGVSPDKAVELANIIRRRLCADEDYYLISDEFLSQVYPTPTPKELEFIKNKDVRWMLWRELRKNLVEQYKIYMVSAFEYILKTSGLFDVDFIKKLAPNASLYKVKFDDLRINMLFYAVNGDIKSVDIEEVSKWIKSIRPPIHCVIILYTGEITQEAKDKIINKGLGEEGENVILDLKIHPTLARRIICMYRAHNEYTQDTDINLLVPAVRKLVTQDIDFEGKMKNWLSTQEQKGILIKELKVDATSNLREFADSLKFYINFIEIRATPEEIFKKNKEELLDKFIKYGSKVGLIPDIELPHFQKLTEDLMKNGFLEKIGNTYEVKPHPVEKRILKILERETKLSEKELEDFFIIKSARILKDVFLPILNYKGLVKREGDYYLLNKSADLFQHADQEYQRFKRQIEGKKQLWDYGYMFLWKKRKEYRFITLKEFVEYIDIMYQEAKGCRYEADESRVLQKLSLLMNLLDHFNKNFLPVFNAAAAQATEILNEMERTYTEFKDRLAYIKDKCSKWLKLEFKIESIREYGEITKLFESVREIASYGYDEVRDLIGKFSEEDQEKFSFNLREDKAFYFNPKLYQIEQFKDKFDNLMRGCTSIIDEMDGIFKDLEKKLSDIDRKIRIRDIKKECEVSTHILEVLKQLLKDILPEIPPNHYDSIDLNRVREIIRENKEYLLSTLKDLDDCIQQLQETAKNEKTFLTTLSNAQEFASHIIKVFDTNDYKKYIADFSDEIRKIEETYRELKRTISSTNAKKLLEQISKARDTFSKLDKDLKEKESEINKAWATYVVETRDFTERISNLLDLIKKKYKIPYEPIKKQLASLNEAISVEDVRKISLGLSKLKEMKEEIHKRFYEGVQPFLDRKEIDILQLIIDETKTERKSWLSLEELYDIVERRLKTIPKKDIEKIIDKLTKERLLRVGVSPAL